jgi:hypothetical protein
MNQQTIKSYFQGKSFTLEGRLFYPKLFTPEAKKDGGRLQYNAMFAWNFNSNATALAQVVSFLTTAKQNFFPTVPDLYFVNPIKKYGVYQRQDGKPVPAFLKDCYWINAQSGADFPPIVVDQNRNPVIDPSIVYSGANAVLNFSFYAIDKEKKGMGVNLNAVMIRGGGEREGGVPTVDVNRVFGDFAADMGMGSATPGAANNQWPPQVPSQQQQQQPVQKAGNGMNQFM